MAKYVFYLDNFLDVDIIRPCSINFDTFQNMFLALDLPLQRIKNYQKLSNFGMTWACLWHVNGMLYCRFHLVKPPVNINNGLQFTCNIMPR